VEANLRSCPERNRLGKSKSSHAVEWFSLMPRKKKNKPATTPRKRTGKSSKRKTQSARKASAKKQKSESEVLPVLNSDKLKELYAVMVKCRLLTEHVQGAQTAKQNSVSGFEAALVGAGAHLHAKDCIALEYGSFVASLIKGTSLNLILAQTKVQPTSNGTGKSASPKKAGGTAALSMDTVMALAAEMKGKNAVTLMFCTQYSEALLFDSEAMAVAATQKLPLVCLVESSLDSRLELPNQNASGPYIAADASFYPRIPVDGCDAVGVFRVAQEAIRRAREGHGPALIECLTSRSSAPSKNDAEQASARFTAPDPLTFMEQYLRRRDLWSDEWSQSIVAGFNKELNNALTSLENQTKFDLEFDNVYSSDGRMPRPQAASGQ
jgi:TPP-dependent pyruvate/acetoin dehydrogenase alpha subunit